MEDVFMPSDIFLETVRQTVAEGGSISVEGTGDSMRPFILPGSDVIILSPVKGRLKRGDICLYVREGRKPVIHRVYAIHADSYDMRGDNQLWVEKNVPRESVIAVLTERIRNGSERLDCRSFRSRMRAYLSAKKKMKVYRTKSLAVSYVGKIKEIIQK